ncbi:MAG: helix-hairpin-helix domain-containing protein [Thermoanaerobaculia bacterium]|nr:helix-hairpin-helix domain-containing protein [Thermoanaerobaculia bacterium]
MKTSRTSYTTQSALARRFAAALLLLATLVTGLPAMAAEAGSEASGGSHPGVVNVNTADAEQLRQLPRVGPALADRILAYRESHGKFETPEDLLLIQGIGERTFEMLRSFVVVEGETTLARKLKSSDVPSAEGP